MAIPTMADTISEEAYRAFALGDPSGQWELHQGQLQEKPGMSVVHGDVVLELATMLRNQLDRDQFRVRANHARLRVAPDTYFVPDVVVIPAAVEQALRVNPRALDAYSDPMMLVVEIWSPSTGHYGITARLRGYQWRGDREIWRIQPYDRILTAWRWRPDHTYAESIHRGGVVLPESLPGATIDLDVLLTP